MTPAKVNCMNQFSIDRRTGVLLVQFNGAVTVETLRKFDEEVKALMAVEGAMPAIVDFTGLTSVDLATPAVVERGGRQRLMPGQPRVFVSANSLLFGFLRVYGAYQDGIGEKAPIVVSLLSEAFRALSVTDPQFEPVTIPSGLSELPAAI
jgi:hypothetical protein